MKTAKRILFGAMAALAMVGCSDDKLGQDGPNGPTIGPDDEDGVFLNVTIKMPTAGGGSRSFTDGPNSSNDKTEVGHDYENTVNTVYLVLAKKTDNPNTNNQFIAWGEIAAADIVKNSNGTLYNSTAKFSKSDIGQYYDNIATDDNNRDVNVFVFCNPTLKLRNLFEGLENKAYAERGNTWVDEICDVDANDNTVEVIWSDNDFLMTNAEIATRTLPKTIDDWNYYTEKTKPFNLSGVNTDVNIDNSANNEEHPRGAVKVERAAARFDFKDGSGGKYGVATYQVIFGLETDEDGNEKQGDCYVEIKLNKMSLVNMSKQFYYLRRVSPTGLPTDVRLCGPELPWFINANGTPITGEDGSVISGNYVVGPYATEMATGNGITTNFSHYYNYPLFDNQGEIDNLVINNWYTSTIEDVLGGQRFDQKADNDGNLTAGTYHIWRYCTENVIPGVDEQQNGQTTGIVFKGKMQATAAALNSDDENVREVARIINNVADENGIKPLSGNPAEDPILYKFTGTKNYIGGMYATWPNVEKEAKNGAVTVVWEPDNNPDNKYGGTWKLEINRSNTLFHAVYGDGGCGQAIEVTYKDKDGNEKKEWLTDPVDPDPKSANSAWHNWQTAKEEYEKATDTDKPEKETAMNNAYDAFKKAMTSNNFTLYQSSYDGADENGYFCYYYYWNRHNDNGKNGILGPMEFDVVRNNVYKISVKAINTLGHPRITSNDPNPPTPTTKDEVDDVYITVDVDVLPWVVRINEIEF